jgi:hypothetical protein
MHTAHHRAQLTVYLRLRGSPSLQTLVARRMQSEKALSRPTTGKTQDACETHDRLTGRGRQLFPPCQHC